MSTMLGDTNLAQNLMSKRRNYPWTSRQVGRDATAIANGTLSDPWDVSPSGASMANSYESPLLLTEDRRLYSPTLGTLDYPPAKRISGAPARLIASSARAARPDPRYLPKLSTPTVRVGKSRSTELANKSLSPSVDPRVSFNRPPQVALCERRALRKEIILATGRGGGKHKKPKLNRWSSISCKG
ncbi:MAG: hypothetical protein [Microviridae sp.]|nr:MAG: hypothetical protein [Microviridae sp.]